ncbi:MAG: plasmid replication protein RepC [Pseudomonadota bacterium]
MKHNGWRKPTPGLVVAEQHAQAGERLAVPKTQAIVACKKVASALGLKAPDLLLLDTLAAATQAQDWEKDRRPIVWASNEFLTAQCGFSLSALRRHVRRLCEMGIIAMKDSANGKRWGRRDEDGYIVQAYGFDLSPLAARASEFEACYAAISEERRLCKVLKSTLTVTRRMIRAKIEKAIESRLRGPWLALSEEFETMLRRLPRRSTSSENLMHLVDWFRAFCDRVDKAFSAAFDGSQDSDSPTVANSLEREDVALDMTPRDAVSGTHILTTNEPDPVTCNRFETKHAAGAVPKDHPIVPVENQERDGPEIEWNTHTKRRRSKVDVPTLMGSCPQFAETARSLEGYIRDWNHLHRAAARIRPIVGISEDAWNIAQRKLGPEIAAAAIALIFDKTSDGEIQSPGGYLRGMVEKAAAGELHLDRSIYGRLSESRAP